MVEAITGSKSREQVLLFITARNQAYAREISSFYGVSISPIQNQLKILEESGILISQYIGKTRVYSFNPRYAIYKELKLLLEKALLFLPETEREKLTNVRKRPRRIKKPIKLNVRKK